MEALRGRQRRVGHRRGGKRGAGEAQRHGQAGLVKDMPGEEGSADDQGDTEHDRRGAADAEAEPHRTAYRGAVLVGQVHGHETGEAGPEPAQR